MLLAAAGGVFGQLTGFSHLAGPIAMPAGLPASSVLIMLATAALTCVLAGLLARAARTATAVTMAPLRGRAAALRAQSRLTAFLRQRDPDAAGRSRPRAPAAGPAAA